ncbi:uncharacterized protein LOC132188706 [Corylus avellana]|uniref:uncharacterized protein LOC132188706 n=1 Tax=Corylus avellana TaxID=13451 RepID=UPI001E1F4109|nr:uncharacterized protein LOC132188706 [Corylus avellana]
MAHAGNSLRSTLVTLFIFAIILSPMATSDAARLTQRASGPICPACVCCTPPPLGSCCKCCATPSPIAKAENGSP